MTKSTHQRIERAVIAIMLLGIVGMFQPLHIAFYTYGFVLVLVGTLSFIAISHITPADAD